MPLIPTQMQSLIQLRASSELMAGSKLQDVVSAISMATCQYLQVSAIVNSTNIVLGPGAGTQTGNVVDLLPQAMSSMMLLNASSLGLAGRDLPKLFDAVSTGVVNTIMTSVIVQGTVIGGGPGVGTGKITGLVPTALQSMILLQEALILMAGSKIKDVASAIAFGICNHIMTAGTVMLTDIGFFTPPPVVPIPIPVAPGIGFFA